MDKQDDVMDRIMTASELIKEQLSSLNNVFNHNMKKIDEKIKSLDEDDIKIYAHLNAMHGLMECLIDHLVYKNILKRDEFKLFTDQWIASRNVNKSPDEPIH